MILPFVLAAALLVEQFPSRSPGGGETPPAAGLPSPSPGGGEGQGEGAPGPHGQTPSTPRAAVEPDSGPALHVYRLLAAEDVDAARAALEPLVARRPDDAVTRLALGMLRFHEQRYDEAVKLLESAAPRDPSGYLALARGAREVTKSHVRSESEHFVVSHPPGKDEVLVPYLVDTLERQRAALQSALGYSPPGKLAVEIVNDVKELARLTTLTDAEIRTSGTVAICKFNKLMLLSPKALLKGYDWQDTAAHEYTHLVLTRTSRNEAPVWLQEGLAKWFEEAWRGGKQPISPFAAALVRDAAQRNALVTFDEMHPSLAKLPSQERAALAYAEVVLAVEQMVAKGGSPSVLRTILDLLAKGRSAKDAVAEAIGVPFDRFLDDWKRHMVSRPLPHGGEHELKRLRFRDDPKHGGTWSEWAEIQDARARGFARLGEIMRERGRFGAARVEYGKALARVGARYPILSDQYALASMAAGEDAEAEKALAEAIGWNPHYAALHVHLARLLVRRQDFARARDHLLLANREDPFDPEIHAGLAKALAALGDTGGASREERFARILLPEGHR